jgi:hypothetical protein
MKDAEKAHQRRVDRRIGKEPAPKSESVTIVTKYEDEDEDEDVDVWERPHDEAVDRAIEQIVRPKSDDPATERKTTHRLGVNTKRLRINVVIEIDRST